MSVPGDQPQPVSTSPPRGRPRRILFLDHTALMGGGEVALLNLVLNLDRRRFQPVVLLASEGPLLDKFREAGIETHLRPLPASLVHARKDTLGWASLARLKDVARLLWYAVGLAAFAGRARIQLIHTNSLKADIIGGLAGKMAGIPVLWHVRDRISSDYLPRAAVLIFRLLSYGLPRFIIANSAATLATLPSARTTRGPIVRPGSNHKPPELLNVVHSGLSGSWRTKAVGRVVHDGLPVSNLAETAPAAVRTVGLVGRLSPWKGQHVFLQAAAQVIRRHPEVRFQIIGAALFNEQAYEQQVRALCTSLGLDSVVEFTGFRSDVAQMIARLEILVHASTTPEPFGQVIIEGMLAGKPVVATDAGGVQEIVQRNRTGLLVPMNDANAMARAISQLLEDQEAAKAMGELGRQRVLEHFTIAHTAEKVQAVYEYLLHD